MRHISGHIITVFWLVDFTYSPVNVRSHVSPIANSKSYSNRWFKSFSIYFYLLLTVIQAGKRCIYCSTAFYTTYSTTSVNHCDALRPCVTMYTITNKCSDWVTIGVLSGNESTCYNLPACIEKKCQHWVPRPVLLNSK